MQAVNAELPRFRPLIERQNTDQRIYDLEEWMGEPGFEAVDMEMRGYTTNHPQVYANKLKTIVKTSGLRVKIFTARETESQRRINQGKRDWTMAILKRADTWLSHYLELPLMDQMAHSLALRGWAAGRCLLRQDLNGETVVDVRPWDPRNVVWKLGPNGLLWICNRRYMTYSEIAATFPTTMRPLTRDEREDQQLLLVYDYLDSRYNTVFAEGLPIKMRRPHGADHVPAYISYVGDVTPTFAATMTTEQLDKVGESCYAAVRDLYSTLNYLISSAKQRVAQKIRYAVVYVAKDKSSTLPVNPYTEGGAELTVEIGESVQVLQLPDLGEEFFRLLDFVLSEIQRGSLPHVAFGELQAAISGYAINQLRDAVGSAVMPIVSAQQTAYQQIVDKLMAQYVTGDFRSVSIPGEWDDETIAHVQQGDDAMVEFIPALPEDIAAKLQTAQMARQPDAHGMPLFDDATIRDKIVDFEDEEGIQDRIHEQMAKALTPTAMMQTLAQAAMNRDDELLANDYLMSYQLEWTRREMELKMTQMQMQMMMQGGGEGGPGGAGGAPATPPSLPILSSPGGGGQPGIDNALVPQQVLGMNQPEPVPQAGPIVPEGTPRPGAQQGP